MKRKQQNDLENAAEKQLLKQLCKDFQNMIRTEDGARFFVFMMECYNAFDVDSFISTVSEAFAPLLEAELDTFSPISTKTRRKGVQILKRKQQNDLENAAEKQLLKQLCKDFQNMIRTKDGALFFVFMMECYNAFDVDSFISTVSEAFAPLLEAELDQDN